MVDNCNANSFKVGRNPCSCYHRCWSNCLKFNLSAKCHTSTCSFQRITSQSFIYPQDIILISQAVNKMGSRVEAGQRTTCILEIGDQGIKMVDKSKPGVGVNHIISSICKKSRYLYDFPIPGQEWGALPRVFLWPEKCHFLRIPSERPPLLCLHYKGG